MANAKKFEAQLAEVYAAHEGVGAELKFLSTVFTFLQGRSGFFGKPNATRLTRALLKKHTDRAAAAAPAAESKEKDKAEEAAAGPPLEGNGGTTDRYTWTQTLAEVTVQVPLPSGKLKARDVAVEMAAGSLRVGVRGADEPLAAGELSEAIVPGDSTWIIDREGGGASVTLFLRKAKQMAWWTHVLRGDPEIDVKQVTPEASKLSDLDPSTRGTVEKMMFDQRQKERNLPTSDEMRKQEMMERFMAQHPELDFSNAKMM